MSTHEDVFGQEFDDLFRPADLGEFNKLVSTRMDRESVFVQVSGSYRLLELIGPSYRSDAELFVAMHRGGAGSAKQDYTLTIDTRSTTDGSVIAGIEYYPWFYYLYAAPYSDVGTDDFPDNWDLTIDQQTHSDILHKQVYGSKVTGEEFKALVSLVGECSVKSPM